MKSRIWLKIAAISIAGVVAGSAWSESAVDVGLVNALKGDVTYQGKTGTAKKAQPYMRLRHGDKVILSAGSSIRVSYTTISQQESWTGPGSFVATSSGGELLKGSKPDVKKLPAAVPQRLARISELMNTSRVGGLVVRSVKVKKSASNDEIAEAMAAYEVMRAEAAPSDVTPELFLYSVFEENGMVEDLKIVARNMLAIQPDNPEIQRLVKVALSAQ